MVAKSAGAILLQFTVLGSQFIWTYIYATKAEHHKRSSVFFGSGQQHLQNNRRIPVFSQSQQLELYGLLLLKKYYKDYRNIIRKFRTVDVLI